MSKSSIFLFYSIVISVLVHTLFFAAAKNMRVEFVPSVKKKKVATRTQIHFRDVRELLKTRRRKLDVGKLNQRKALRNKLNKLLRLHSEQVAPKKKLVLDMAPKVQTKLPKFTVAEPKLVPPKVIELSTKDLPEHRKSVRRIAEKVVRRKYGNIKLPSGLAHGTNATPPELLVGVKPRIPSPFINSPLGGDDGDLSGLSLDLKDPGGLDRRKKVASKDKSSGKMDRFLNVSMAVQEEPGAGGYYRIDIEPNARSARWLSVPKDVLFLVDSSKSISSQKLAQFRQGTMLALETLRPGDYFDVAGFRNEAHPCFGTYRQAYAHNVKEAINYMRYFKSYGLTDLYGSLVPFLKEKRKGGRPLLIFLITDGISTTAKKLQDNVLIKKVLDENSSNTSLFCFSIGDLANHFLLEFLAFQNRGVSMNETDLSKGSYKLYKFLEAYSDIVVSDLGYKVLGESGNSTFPKQLPHLYRGETLSIYGRFKPGAKEVILRLTGKISTGDQKELIFRKKIAKATRSATIDRIWASNKIFHLMSENVKKPSRKLKSQIDSLSRRYGINP